jgi:hypothetical protein
MQWQWLKIQLHWSLLLPLYMMMQSKLCYPFAFPIYPINRIIEYDIILQSWTIHSIQQLFRKLPFINLICNRLDSNLEFSTPSQLRGVNLVIRYLTKENIQLNKPPFFYYLKETKFIKIISFKVCILGYWIVKKEEYYFAWANK